MSSASLVCFLVATALTAALIAYWRTESLWHNLLLDGLSLRVHVNGIRGKSSVTRLIAGVLCEAGIRTIAKTTGTAAVLISPELREQPIERRAAPSVLEQIRLLSRYVDDSIQAIVIECMAVRPAYQAICEEKIIRAHVAVITNVREDHQEQMGQTLPEITRSLLNTCPRGGILLTAEQDPELLEIMRREVERRDSRLFVADPDDVSDDYMRRFGYVEFKENVALGLALASLLNIDRETALRGMLRAPADPGVLRIEDFEIDNKRVTFANVFSANDRQSVLNIVQQLYSRCGPDTTRVALLNNRADRADRAMLFADVVTRDLEFDRIALLGAYEQAVSRRILDQQFPSSHLIRLGEHRDFSVDEMIQQIVLEMPTDHVMLVGLVNVHTHQAEMIVQRLQQYSAIPACL